MTAAVWPITRTMEDHTPWSRGLTPERQAHIRRCRAAPVELGPTRPWGHNSWRTGLVVPVEQGCYVYAHLAADGAVLYVGKTTRPAQRCSHHVSRAPWWTLVDSIMWERQDNSDAAYWRELEIIALLGPRYNVVGTERRPRRQRGDRRTQRVERQRKELQRLHAPDENVVPDVKRLLAHGYPIREVFDAIAGEAA